MKPFRRSRENAYAIWGFSYGYTCGYMYQYTRKGIAAITFIRGTVVAFGLARMRICQINRSIYELWIHTLISSWIHKIRHLSRAYKTRILNCGAKYGKNIYMTGFYSIIGHRMVA